MSTDYLIDKIQKDSVKEMSAEEVNFAFDQLMYKDTTEQKRVKLLEYLGGQEAQQDKITKDGETRLIKMERPR